MAASKDGDTIAVQAGTYTNDFATINTKITIIGVGGMANLVATQPPPNGKGIFVTNTDVRIENLSFSGAKVADGNGAGIRYQDGHLTIVNSQFHHNENGLLSNASPTGLGGMPKNVVMLTCDAFGVLPPISRLTHKSQSAPSKAER